MLWVECCRFHAWRHSMLAMPNRHCLANASKTWDHSGASKTLGSSAFSMLSCWRRRRAKPGRKQHGFFCKKSAAIANLMVRGSRLPARISPRHHHELSKEGNIFFGDVRFVYPKKPSALCVDGFFASTVFMFMP